jgi:hypothetical protein
MSRTCRTHGGEEKRMQKVYLQSMQRRDHLEDVSVDMWIILNCARGARHEIVNWSQVDQNRVQQRSLQTP